MKRLGLVRPTRRGSNRGPARAPYAARPYAFGRAVAVGLYVSDAQDKGELGRLILALKRTDEGGADLAEALDHVLRARFDSISFVAIIPIPPQRDNPRNAPLVLARALSARRDIPILRILELEATYRSDKGAPSGDKFESTRGNFSIPDPAKARDRRVLLVDDVLTTCGHAHWAAEALRAAGATDVNVAVLGRTVDRAHLELIGYSGRA